MPIVTSSEGLSFRDLVFSDLERYRPGKQSWLSVLATSVSHPGMVAQTLLRAQQCLFRSGHVRLAFVLRSLGMYLFSADFVPGMDIGPGLFMPHPNGVVIGNGLRVGANVSIGDGITAGVKQPDVPPDEEGFPTIADGAIVLAHAVLAGPVTVGNYAQVGANSVVLSDVPDYAVVFGVPARKVAERKGIIPGSYELVSEPPAKEVAEPPAEKAPARKAPAEKAPAEKAPTKKTAAKKTAE
jgi:serine O-acetyltransferase